MSDSNDTFQGCYARWAPLYLAIGIAALPVKRGTKSCHITGWNDLDPVRDAAGFKLLIGKYPNCGIGIRMGAELADGTRLGAIDIDNNAFVGPVRHLLGGPIVGRVGQKGAAIFVRVRGELRRKGVFTAGGIKTADLLFKSDLCVIPPTIHPDTDEPYTWLGKPLHEVDLNILPVVEM